MKLLINRMSRACLNQALGLLLIRVLTGVIFLTHGAMKFQNLAGTEQFFSMLGLATVWAPIVAAFEVVGGLMLITGVMTRVAGVSLGVIMLFAVFLTGLSRGIAAHELEALLCAASFGLALTGSGRYSVFAMECRDCNGMLCKPGAEHCSGKKV